METTEIINSSFPRYQDTNCLSLSGEVFVEKFFNRFHDSFLFSFVLQFLLVSLMYANVGKGIYWKVLFYSSLAGLCASLMESAALSHMCLKSLADVERPFSAYLLLIDEVFWIISEYSIPVLNLIKMKAFATGKSAVILKVVIIGLAIPFMVARFIIGYSRMTDVVLSNTYIQKIHGYAFGIMAFADIICTVGILYFVKKNNSHSENNTNLNDYIKHSSYTILITVDIVSACLSILDIITVHKQDLNVMKSITVPLQCLKSSFALILAIDAFLFKYGANVTSINESSGANSKYIGYGNNSSNNINLGPYKSSNYSSHTYNNSFNSNKKTTYSIDMTNNSNNGSPKKSNQSNIVSPYNYPSIDKDSYNNKKSPKMDSSIYSQKSIVKNYTNIQTNSIFAETNNDPYELKVYSPNNFGFLISLPKCF